MGSHYKIDAHAVPAATADDVIKRQGGLSPSYGPSGINDLYNRAKDSAFDKLQQSRVRAQSGDSQGADMLEKAQQAQGMGFGDIARGIRNNVAARDTLGQVGGGNQNADVGDAINQGLMDAPVGYYPPTTYDPSVVPEWDDSTLNAEAASKGGMSDGNPIVTGEKGPETKFNQDGSIEQIDQPTVMQHPKPGVIVPNPRLQAFLKRFMHPPEDMAKVKMYANGGEVQPPHYAADDLVGDAGALAGPPLGGVGGRVKRALPAYAQGGQVHSWEEPGYTAADRFAAGRDAVAAQQADAADTNASEMATNNRVFNRGTLDLNPYGTGSNLLTSPEEQPPPTIQGLPSQEFFQRSANSPFASGGPNAFAQPEADSGYMSQMNARMQRRQAPLDPRMQSLFARWRTRLGG